MIDLELALEMGKLGYWEWNSITNEVYWSQQKKKIFGLAADFVTTIDSVFQLVHHDDRNTIMNIIGQKMPLKQPFEYSYRGLHSSGKILTIWVKAEVLTDDQGDPTGISGVSQDISERVLYEQNLKELNQLKNSVLSSLSHGLRNPLGGIMTLCELIRHNHGKEAALNEKISEIEHTCRQALNLIEEVAGNANLETSAGRLTTDKINLTGYLNTTIRANKYLAVSRHITVHTLFPHKPVYVKINSQKLLQSLGRMLSTAIQNAEEFSVIALELSEVNNLVRIGVKDLGVQKNASVAEIASRPETYRGKLWVELEQNKGANFFVELQTG